MRAFLALSLSAPLLLYAQPPPSPAGVQPYVDHWDSLRTIKRSEGLFINGREWGEWKFWDRQGRLFEVAEFKSGERDGHVVMHYDNGQVQHDGYFHRGKQDSLMQSFYRDGKPMEKGSYSAGKKKGLWEYWYADAKPYLREDCADTLCLLLDAWDPQGVQVVKAGDGLLRTWYASGAVHEETAYKFSVPSGPFVEHYPAGNPKAKGE